MGKGIGDYIHYSYQNYKKHGLNNKGNAGQGDPYGAWAMQKEHLLSRINNVIVPAEVREIEKIFNNIYSSYYKKSSIEDNEFNQWIQGANQIIQQKYDSWIPDNVGGVYSKTQPTDKMARISRQKLWRIEKMVENKIKQLTLQGGAKKEDIAFFEKGLADVNALMAEINADRVYAIRNDTNKDLFTRIKELEMRAKLPKNQVIGGAFEYFCGAVSVYLDDLAEEEGDKILTEAIEKKVVGGNLTGGGIQSNISTWIGNGIKDKKNYLQNNGGTTKYWLNDNLEVEHNIVQQKADFTMRYHGQDLNVSAKNYYQANQIKLGTPSLFTVISGENADFVNHYLNLATSRGRGSSGASKAYQNYMKLTAAIKAMSGYGINALGNADYFIVQERSTGKIRFYSVYDLVTRLESNIDAIHLSGKHPGSDNNSWVGDKHIPDRSLARERINNLLSSLHAIKWGITLNVTAI